ncbi:MAG TPA: hypothetical protein VFQ45_14865 [Longimicrobium sp.]|nr:hypothetical protein [Longimicrobium sp.]
MKLRTHLPAALAVAGVFAASFAAAHAVALPRQGARLGPALDALRLDAARTVCLGRAPCVHPEAEYTLFLYFAESDCAGGLYHVAVLERAYREAGGRLNVVGVAGGFSREEAERFARASEITYPLYVDAERMRRWVPDPKPARSNRPASVLVDRRGRVVETRTSSAAVGPHQEGVAALLRRVGRS